MAQTQQAQPRVGKWAMLQVQQVGAAKGGKVGHVAGAAGGCSQGWESEHFVAIAHVDVAHCGIGMARAGQ